jgi:hypothetical protein
MNVAAVTAKRFWRQCKLSALSYQLSALIVQLSGGAS